MLFRCLNLASMFYQSLFLSFRVNFTNEETRKLRELVEHNKYVLFNKKSTAVSNRLKDETWNAIAQEFNSCSTTYRSAKQLKYKFDNMKKLARKVSKQTCYPNERSFISYIDGFYRGVSVA